MKKYRWVVIFGACMINFLVYIDRINLSVAATTIMKEFSFSAAQLGLLLGAMLPGYMLLNFAGGALVDRFSPMKVLNVGVVIWSLATAWFTALSTFNWMYVSRFIFGAAEGVTPPALVKINSNWMLPKERGRSIGLAASFNLVAIAVGAPICGVVIQVYGWRVLFISLAIFGFIVLIIANIIMKSSPREHRWVSKEELDLIENTLEEERIQKEYAPGQIAVREEVYAFLKNPYLWLMALGYFAIIAAWWASLSWLPGYLVKEKGFTVLKSGIWSSLPYIVGFVGIIAGGIITDKMKGRRMPFIILCHLLMPPLVFLAIGASSNVTMILFFAASMFFTSGGAIQYFTLPIDMFPRKLSGTAAGIITGVGTLGGMFAPVFMGWVFDLTKSFYWGFGSLAIVTLIGAVICIPLLYHENSKLKGKKEISKEAASLS